jgi:hypothetical protein
MTKEITLTNELIEKFHQKFGEDVDFNNFYIIKVRAISTEPVHQNTIFDGAVLSAGSISEMKDLVNYTDENIGVLTMHDSSELNVGRVFYSEVADEGGVTALYAYLAILKTDDTKDLIAKIENNVLDEVSVSFTPKHAVCSKCDFDYMGEEADIMNFLTQTCPEGHTIGIDGCHLMLSGIEHFSEISIVNRGAATHAKILQEKRTTHYSEEELRKLAASAKKADLCVATFTNKLEKKMTVEKTNEILLDEKIAALEAENAQLKQSLDLAEKVKDLEGKLEASYTKVAELTETLAKAEEEKEAAVAEKTAEIETLKNEKAEQETKLSGAMDFIKAEVQKVLVASGEANLSIPEDLDGIANLLAERQQMLASLIPAGGVSATAKTKNNAELIAGYTEAQLKAFQVKK